MSDAPVSLSRFRKDKAREDARRQAEANAVKFGRTKSEKAVDKMEAQRKARLLDGAKRE